MPGEFDMDSAVSQVSEGLDLGLGDTGSIAAGAGAGTESVTGGEGIEAGVGDTSTGDAGAGDEGQTAEQIAAAAAAKSASATSTPTTVTAPRTWRQEAAAMWEQVPAPVQQEILKREEDIFKGIESYKAAAEFGAPLKQVLDPYLPILQQYNIQPAAQVADMMKAHHTLAFGTPEEKVALVQQVIRDYRIDPASLGLPAGGNGSEYVDPQVAGLRKEIDELKSRLTQNDRAAYEAKRQEVTRHVEAFAADPKNLYFEELANDIAHLLSTSAEKTVETAYQTAMWRNPAVRAKELARQQAERTAAEKKARDDQIAAAKKATSANVRTQARSGSAAAPLGSMDDTLSSTLAEIRTRV